MADYSSLRPLLHWKGTLMYEAWFVAFNNQTTQCSLRHMKLRSILEIQSFNRQHLGFSRFTMWSTLQIATRVQDFHSIVLYLPYSMTNLCEPRIQACVKSNFSQISNGPHM